MKQYKHKQTGDIAIDEGKTVQEKPVYRTKREDYNIPAYFIENTSDWELIPETPKMEVVEGYSTTEDFKRFISYNFSEKEIGYRDIPTLIITNPTSLMREVVKQIEAGKCYERYITGREIKLLPKEDGQNSYFYLNVTDSDADLHKIIIIPIQESEVEK